MRGRRTPRTERARDGYQVPREAPVRSTDGRIEPWVSLKGYTRRELLLRNDCLAFGADLVVTTGGYAITTSSGSVIATCSNMRAVRTWLFGRMAAGGLA